MILITGAMGHLGNVLTRDLIGRGEKVRALVLPGEDTSYLQNLGIEFVEGNILDADLMQKICEGIDTVFHMAAVVSIAAGSEALMHKVNVEGTKNMLQAAKSAGVRRFIYTSSVHAYGRVKLGLGIDETLPFDTSHTAAGYDQTKALASYEVLKAAEQGLDCVLVCPTGVIGPYDYKRSEIGELILSWMKPGVHFMVDGVYDFVDVRDVSSGHILAAEKGRRGEVYLLSGHRAKVKQLADIVTRYTKVPALTLNFPIWMAKAFSGISEWYYRVSKTRPRLTKYAMETLESNSVINRQKAEVELGYQPRSLEETVQDTVDWWKEHSEVKASLRSKEL